MVFLVTIKVVDERSGALAEDSQQLLLDDADLRDEGSTARPLTFHLVVGGRPLGTSFLVLVGLHKTIWDFNNNVLQPVCIDHVTRSSGGACLNMPDLLWLSIVHCRSVLTITKATVIIITSAVHVCQIAYLYIFISYQLS